MVVDVECGFVDPLGGRDAQRRRDDALVQAIDCVGGRCDLVPQACPVGWGLEEREVAEVGAE
ncbi:MAG: hypothetical protein M5T61_13460 [Acidimicrobiia bacterium]|nr:hypothetical protein [Acidimicrobiia bacterium]